MYVKKGGFVMLRLREIRKENGISLKKLGEIVGVAESTMSLYENEKRQPDYETLKKLADYFNVTTDYLLGREDKTTLTTKDKKEITEILESTRQQLLSQEGLMFDGEPASEEDVQKIIMAMQMGMEMIKKENKEKYTPKKYRK